MSGREGERNERESDHIVWPLDIAYFDETIVHALEKLSVSAQRWRLQIA